ncbi:acetyl-lysine deacetylase [Bacillus licheniformis]|jgi:putative aminopeptidase FrvX|nr:Cellulase [Bacillus licheniformis]ARC66261.1 acetyl-lysine deacetylase [Bacillus licheniformis]KJE31060.1 deblocking aminopeptidase [Bacillus licheniformis]OAZ63802.1 Cellulase [Bacillus licheniformis]TWK61925.1 N-acetyl-lysine deacetylase [Bacillus licheniformis]
MSGQKTMELIKELVSIPSPTGNTYDIIDYINRLLEKEGVETRHNRKGGLIATIPGSDKSRHRMLTAHVDTLGAMVKEIKPNGRLKIDLIGGFNYNSIEGEYCNIETASGKTYTGTILMHQTSVHVYKDAGKAERNQKNMEVRKTNRSIVKKKPGRSASMSAILSPSIRALKSRRAGLSNRVISTIKQASPSSSS